MAPRSVAVLGASTDPARIGGRPIRYMLEQGFAGHILPVNPHRDRVQGLQAYPSVADLPVVPDAAIVAVPADLAVAGGGGAWEPGREGRRGVHRRVRGNERHARAAAGLAFLAQQHQDVPGARAQQADHDLAVAERGVVVRNLAQPRGSVRQRIGHRWCGDRQRGVHGWLAGARAKAMVGGSMEGGRAGG